MDLDTDSADSDTASGQSSTADRILDVAEALIQRRGYNAVSYGDLAEELDMTTAAIHYHFPSKTDLAQVLVRRYRRGSAQKRDAVRAQNDTLRKQLVQYVEPFSGIVGGGGFCLCGILAADAETLPDAARQEVETFFAEQEDWLTEVIGAGTTGGAGLSGCDSPREVARVFLATVEGAMLTIPNRDPEVYADTLHRLIDSIVT